MGLQKKERSKSEAYWSGGDEKKKISSRRREVGLTRLEKLLKTMSDQQKSSTVTINPIC